MCDNCRKTYRMVDASELLGLILEVVQQLNEKFKAEHIVDILKGNETAAVVSYKHNELEDFGAAEDEEESTLHAIIRQAMLSGYLTKDIESYGDLKLTNEGRKFIAAEPSPTRANLRLGRRTPRQPIRRHPGRQHQRH